MRYTLHISRTDCQAQDVEAVVPPPVSPQQLDPLVIALRPLTDAQRVAAAAARAAAHRYGPGSPDPLYRLSLSGRLRNPDGVPAAGAPVRVGQR